VVIDAGRHAAGLALSVTCDDPAATHAPLAAREAASLAMAQELAAYYAAHLSIDQPGPASFAVTLLVAPPEQGTLLVVDDNADWIALVQRYLAGTRYQVVGCRSPEQASSLAEKLQPSAILLDVMMQNVDGWQVLSELRHEPGTSQVPVIICTILPVEGMALSLGASAYLQKPVGQQQLLAALEKLTHR
jgi:CheY-like chemotaxis protein